MSENGAAESYQKIIMVRTTITLIPKARRPTTIASSNSNFSDARTLRRLNLVNS